MASEDEFLAHEEESVAQVIPRLRELARLEAELLLRSGAIGAALRASHATAEIRLRPVSASYAHQRTLH